MSDELIEMLLKAERRHGEVFVSTIAAVKDDPRAWAAVGVDSTADFLRKMSPRNLWRLDVVRLRAEGHSVREIAAETGIPKSTVQDVLNRASGNRPEPSAEASGDRTEAERSAIDAELERLAQAVEVIATPDDAIEVIEDVDVLVVRMTAFKAGMEAVDAEWSRIEARAARRHAELVG